MIQIEDLTFGYGTQNVFEHLGLELPDAAFCVAENGVGKTTLLRLMAGILQPATGRIRVNDCTDFTSSLLLDDAFLFDEFTVKSHLDWLADDQGLDHNKLNDICDKFELISWMDKCPSELSGGQRQWLALAIALNQNADIYLLDEPMRHLDPAHGQKLIELLTTYSSQGKRFLAMAHPGIDTGNIPVFYLTALHPVHA